YRAPGNEPRPGEKDRATTAGGAAAPQRAAEQPESGNSGRNVGHGTKLPPGRALQRDSSHRVRLTSLGLPAAVAYPLDDIRGDAVTTIVEEERVVRAVVQTELGIARLTTRLLRGFAARNDVCGFAVRDDARCLGAAEPPSRRAAEPPSRRAAERLIQCNRSGRRHHPVGRSVQQE